MDIKRGIIFIGLAVVSYLMILAWNDDYGQVKPTNTVVEKNNATFQTPEFNAPETSKVTTDEFSVPENNSTAKIQTTPTSDNHKVISVKTDVLDILIDTQGGNIVQALLPTYKVALHSDEAMALLEYRAGRRYTMESGLYGKNGFDSAKNGAMPVFQSAKSKYELTANQDELVVSLFFKSDNNIEVTKRYTFKRDEYLIGVEYIINNQSDMNWEGNLSGKIVRDNRPDPSQQNSMGMQSFLGMVLSSPAEPYEKYAFDDLTEKPINQTINGGWIAFIQHYFLTAWIPDSSTEHVYQTKVKDNTYLMGFISPATVVKPGETGSIKAQAYVGPKILDRLENAAPNLDLTVDYGFLFFIAYPLFLLLNFLHGFIGNWGFSIILVTIIVKGLFFHLSAASYRSMASMRKVGPQLARLKEQYGDDRQKMSQAMMELYRKEKINPLGGCLPILVQMPVFIALYWVLLESVQLRHAPFALWITDLSVKDPYFLLPILMGVSMFIQMQLNPAPPDPIQARVMNITPIIFTVFFLWFPAGLVLYWLVNNILSIAQQWVITKQIENAPSKS